MSLVVFGSVRGAPGVTTTALLVAGHLPGAVVVEADIDGGTLTTRYRLGREPGLVTLAAARGPREWRDHAQVAGGVPVIVGPDAPETGAAMWARAGTTLTQALTAADATIVVDAGRLRPTEPSSVVLSAATLVVVLVMPRAEHLVGLSHRLPTLRKAADVAVVTLGDGPYRTQDIASQLDVEVLGALPTDRRAAAMLSEGGGSRRGLARTALARAAGDLADTIHRRTSVPKPVAAAADHTGVAG